VGRRKKLGEDSSEQIVTTFIECVRDLGLERASIGEVGTRIGLDRSTVYYYYPTKDALIDAAARAVGKMYIGKLQAAIDRFTSEARGRQLVEHLFGPDFHQHDLMCLVYELNATAARDPSIQRHVVGIYRAFETCVLAELEAAYPNATAKNRRALGYVVWQLAEGCAVVTALGLGEERRLAARASILALIQPFEENEKAAQKKNLKRPAAAVRMRHSRVPHEDETES
jgi:AcrR family transcriptional regulator